MAAGITAIVLLIAVLVELARRRVRAIEAENERLKAEMGSVEAEKAALCERLDSELNAAAQPTPRVQFSGSTLSSLSRQSSSPAAGVRLPGIARRNSEPARPVGVGSLLRPVGAEQVGAEQPRRPSGGGSASVPLVL